MDAASFIETIPDFVVGRTNVERVYAVCPEPCGKSGRCNIYSKNDVVAAGVIKRGSEASWISHVTRLAHRHRVPPEVMASFPGPAFSKLETIDAQKVWPTVFRPVHFCLDCACFVPNTHHEKTGGVCNVEIRFVRCCENPKLVKNLGLCLVCNGVVHTDGGGFLNHVRRHHWGGGVGAECLLEGVTRTRKELCEPVRQRLASLVEMWRSARVVAPINVTSAFLTDHMSGDETVAVVGASSANRFRIHNLATDASVFSCSIGTDPDRVLLLWKTSSVKAILSKSVPEDVADRIVSETLAMHRSDAQRAQTAKPRWRQCTPRRVRSCDECGASSDECEILMSVYWPGSYCDECIEADEELSAHKWEP
jgi:regulator of extracellular matrix RemA (YlzA/DUF370 family)